jgi:hypothetical protein
MARIAQVLLEVPKCAAVPTGIDEKSQIHASDLTQAP